MALQRQVSPIPPGRYWISVVGKHNIFDFDVWLREMAGAVRVETVSLDRSGPEPHQFIIFRVPEGRAPFLNAFQFGFPEFAGPEITNVQDVSQVPATPHPLDTALEAVQTATEAASKVLPIGLLLLALFLVSSVMQHAPARRRAA